ncbi:MAG TPA: hypothetical protein ENI70_01340 [Candidatus Peregrinibacteria bacterium]|nr:hypothetical protein [Candidatus Peregrinibacteria bacterium]
MIYQEKGNLKEKRDKALVEISYFMEILLGKKVISKCMRQSGIFLVFMICLTNFFISSLFGHKEPRIYKKGLATIIITFMIIGAFTKALTCHRKMWQEVRFRKKP